MEDTIELKFKEPYYQKSDMEQFNTECQTFVVSPSVYQKLTRKDLENILSEEDISLVEPLGNGLWRFKCKDFVVCGSEAMLDQIDKAVVEEACNLLKSNNRQ